MANNITLALDILTHFDWWWSLGEDYAYTNGTRTRMQNKMREFVALAAQCEESVCNALRELWKATYEYAHCDWMFRSATAEDKERYETRKSELMEIINPAPLALAA